MTVLRQAQDEGRRTGTKPAAHPVGTELDRRPPPGKQWHDLVRQGSENGAKVPGTCVVCGIALYGWTPWPERRHCGNEHCRIEAERKRPCAFKRLRNVTV